MSTLAIVFIAIAAAIIGFVIGLCVGFAGNEPVQPMSTPNPVKIFNAEPPPVPFVTSKVVLPKRISKSEYTKRVNACLKEAVTKSVNAFVAVSDQSEKRSIINAMYSEWHGKLSELAYSKYNPEFQRLDIVGRKTSSDKSNYRPYSLRFDAAWSLKQPYDCISYARRFK